MFCEICKTEKESSFFNKTEIKKEKHYCKDCKKNDKNFYINCYYKEYNKKRQESHKEYCKKYDKEHKKEINEYKSKSRKIRRDTDPCYKLRENLRSRLRIALKKNYKSGSAVSDLGCSIEELKKHLENKFQEGMTWENHGKNGWHIDHIKPLSKFDLSNREHLLEAVHYTNLQPLWAEDNIKKSDNI